MIIDALLAGLVVLLVIVVALLWRRGAALGVTLLQHEANLRKQGALLIEQGQQAATTLTLLQQVEQDGAERGQHWTHWRAANEHALKAESDRLDASLAHAHRRFADTDSRLSAIVAELAVLGEFRSATEIGRAHV